MYSKPPFGGPEYVLQYLGRYTHRVAISNHRLVSFAEGKVTFVGAILLTTTNRSCCCAGVRADQGTQYFLPLGSQEAASA